MAYENVRAIMHCIYTAPVSDGDGKRRYTGLDDELDMQGRVDLINHVIEVYAEEPADDSTLNVLIWPELFFAGSNGIYPAQIFEALKVKLIEVASGSKWKNWLFVFGTVNVMDQEQGKFSCYALRKAGGTSEIHLHRKFESSFEIIKSKSVLVGNGYTADLYKMHEAAPWVSQRESNFRFKAGDLDLSLEVCADHNKGF